MMRVAINGFGRIGRSFLRVVLQDSMAAQKMKVVAINIGPAAVCDVAHFFKYDSLMGTYPGSVSMKNGQLNIDGHAISVIAETDLACVDWQKFSIDWVMESSGKFTHCKDASKHVTAGAQRVLISAPAQEEDITIIPGVNDDSFDKKKHKIVSLGSCTANALLPMLKVLNESFGIEHGFMTTIHAYTAKQVLLDTDCSLDLRCSRAAALNIIPTTTGATKIIGKIIPELEGLIGGSSVRVPVAKVSLVDLSFVAKKALSIASIKQVFKNAAEGRMKGVLAINTQPLVSSDFSGNSHSVIIDFPLIDVRGNVGKIFGWYDNEWGYSVRLKDFLLTVA